MLNAWALILIALAYVGLLFAIAWLGDKYKSWGANRNFQGLVYALSLAVYCTSWTFFGAVGNAATTGWGFLPIYLGPMLMMLIGFDVIKRMANTAQEQRITSIADFIAHRYGYSHIIAALVTFAAVIGSVPYIALQMKAITTSIELINGAAGGTQVSTANLPLYLAISLAVFSIFFGAREMDSSEHHRGLMWAIAFESLVKLLAFLAIGLFVVYTVFGGFPGVAETIRNNADMQQLFEPWALPEGFMIQLLLAMVAIICLPRQFHVTVVEFRDKSDLRLARWLFPAYLAIFTFFVIPIAVAGLLQFSGQNVDPDTYVLSLPLALDQPFLTLLAFLGGFSAATGMVIVATVALATMVSNDFVMPLLLRSHMAQKRWKYDLSRLLLIVRRVSIVAITLCSLLYLKGIEAGVPLASIGLLSFSAAAQFAPSILIGLYWRGASSYGALTGLVAGMTAWFFWLLLPSLSAGMGDGNVIFDWIPDIDFNRGAGLSLLLNTLTLVAGSLLWPQREPSGSGGSEARHRGLVTLQELQQIIGRFLGTHRTREALATHLGTTTLEPNALAAANTIQFSERLLAGSIGAASARTVLATALSRKGLGPDDVLELLDQTSQAVQFNRELLESTLDNLSQGVSVIDRNLRLVGWNRRYLELMRYGEQQVYLGQPIEELIRLNVERGLMGEGDSNLHISKRLEHFRSGQPYRYERPWLDEMVLEIRGNPMPGGGYVSTFTDISHFKEIERTQKEINETLEQRVRQRTEELHIAAAQMDEAKQLAESANQSKTRFLAAASHDLLQPMNAARLFVSIMRQQENALTAEQAMLIRRIDRSLSGAEDLLSALLDISKLDSGMLKPEPEFINVPELFEQLRRRFSALAENHNLQLRVRPFDTTIYSDRKHLYRILQNFLSNALRYTQHGGVLLGCRSEGEKLRLEVWDTGVGIAPEETEAVFQEFHRLDYAAGLEERGLGLGLAICERVARMLDHPLRLRSKPGRGSCFSVTVPLAREHHRKAQSLAIKPRVERTQFTALRVLCVDNEPDILDAMQLLLTSWGCHVNMAEKLSGVESLLKTGYRPDMALVDYHLGDQHNGLEVIENLNKLCEVPVPAIVITADRSAEIETLITDRGYGILRKPVKPAALRALISNTLQFQKLKPRR